MAGKLKLIFGTFLKSLHQLWLEVTGTFLIVFAAAFGLHAFKEYRKYTTSTGSLWWLAGAGALCLVTLGFGLHSFWKARKLR